jgi:exosortase A-associated hydrolase 2
LLRPFFLDRSDGSRRFCLMHGDPYSARAGVLYVHPFAEEMNKTRRMAALQARAFAAQGVAVLQIDLQGCGDSEGSFETATWQGWLDDLDAARVAWSDWSRKPLLLWGLRAGCLLASDRAQTWGDVPAQIWWQPVAQGRQQLTQWLRLRQTADMLAGSKTEAKALRAELAAGRPVHVAGYVCAPELLLPLEQAQLQNPTGALAWFEVAGEASEALLPASQATITSWSRPPTQSRTLAGSMFWQSTEVEEAPALIEASTAWLREHLA